MPLRGGGGWTSIGESIGKNILGHKTQIICAGYDLWTLFHGFRRYSASCEERDTIKHLYSSVTSMNDDN